MARGWMAQLAQLPSRWRTGAATTSEQGHTVILGWSLEVPSIVEQVIAGRDRDHRGQAVVVLASEPEEMMREQIRARAAITKGTRLVCRTGDPLNVEDLALVNAAAAHSVIVVASAERGSDAKVIKTLMALVRQAPAGRPPDIVAVVREATSRGVAQMVGGERLHVLVSGDIMARVAAQTCRQSGLSSLYSQLFTFGGSEIHMVDAGRLVGLTFSDVLYCFQRSSVIGLQHGDDIRLLPPLDTVVVAGDRIIVIAADRESVEVVAPPSDAIDDVAIGAARVFPRAEHTLIIGWSPWLPVAIRELDRSCLSNSTITVLSNPRHQFEMNALDALPLTNSSLSLSFGDTTSRAVLEQYVTPGCDHIAVFGDEQLPSVEDADASTLVTLLHVRDIARTRGLRCSLVAEVLDSRTRELAEAARADDFVISEHLVALLLAQIATMPERARIFDDLLDAEGAEIYLKPAEHYVQLERSVSFYTVIEAARRRGELAIGYRSLGGGGAVRLNPLKTGLVRFCTGDRIVVVAHEPR